MPYDQVRLVRVPVIVLQKISYLVTIVSIVQDMY